MWNFFKFKNNQIKKFAFLTLLSICVTFIAITSGNSRQRDVPLYNVTNIADTTPMVHHTTTTHHTTTHQSSTTTHPTTAHQSTTTTHHTTTHHTTKTPVKDSTL